MSFGNGKSGNPQGRPPVIANQAKRRAAIAPDLPPTVQQQGRMASRVGQTHRPGCGPECAEPVGGLRWLLAEGDQGQDGHWLCRQSEGAAVSKYLDLLQDEISEVPTLTTAKTVKSTFGSNDSSQSGPDSKNQTCPPDPTCTAGPWSRYRLTVIPTSLVLWLSRSGATASR